MSENKDWRLIIKERLENYNNDVSKITETLSKVLYELKAYPYNMSVKSNLIDRKNLIWSVEIENMSEQFYLSDFNTGLQPSGKVIEDLEEVIKYAILEKFKW